MSPTKLYKFVDHINALEPIIQGSMKFAQKSELNDPSEFIPEVDAERVQRSLNDIRENGHTEAQFSWLCAQGALMKRLCPELMGAPVPRSVNHADRLIQSSFYENIERLTDILLRMSSVFSKRAGVQCLSERWSCLPMWAHYASNGNGFVVQYEGLDEVFRGDDTRLLSGVYKVEYSREHEGITFNPSSYLNLFFSKFADWSYEKEWRIVMPLDDCNSIEADSKRIFIRSIPKKHISALILGWSMSDKDINTVLRTVDSEIDVFRASFQHTGLALERLN